MVELILCHKLYGEDKSAQTIRLDQAKAQAPPQIVPFPNHSVAAVLWPESIKKVAISYDGYWRSIQDACTILVGSYEPTRTELFVKRMSCLPFGDDVERNVGRAYGSVSFAEQTCELSRDELPSDSAEEGPALYFKPVMLYCKIQERAKKNPTFLQRGLRYKIHAKQRKRIQITVSLSRNTNAQLKTKGIFPLYALVARFTRSDILVEGHSPLYQFNQVGLLTSFNESGRSKHSEATFIIPDPMTLAITRACSFDIILVSCGHVGQTFDEINCSENYVENSSVQNLEGKCFWGKIPVSFLRSSLDNCADLILGRTHKFASTIVMSPGYIKPSIQKQDCRSVFCSQKFNDMPSYKLQVSICAEEVGAKDVLKSPYRAYSYSNFSPSSLDLARLRVGNVHFNYMYGNNSCKTEVTEDFTCSFCYMKCGNFKGLEYHLLSSHDLFNFDFKISEKYQAVNVRLKPHTWTHGIYPEAKVDPRHGTFSFFSKYKKYGRLVAGTKLMVPSKATEMIVPSEIIEAVKPGQLVSMGSKSLEYAQVGFEDVHVQKDNGISVPDVSVVPDDSLHGGILSPQNVLQFGKTRKLRVDQFDPRNELLQKRQIFHSHNAQKMSIEEVLSDHDSEGEIDDDVVDLEERVGLDSYSDIGEDQKRIMHMWNSFVRRQRVLCDGHIPWACKAFSELHGQLFSENFSLGMCWRLVMIKFWNHGLLDGRGMDACNRIIDAIKDTNAK